MSSRPKFDSRKATPWDGKEELTPMEAFLKQHHHAHYEERHRNVADSNESEMVNSFVPAKCPYCGREPIFFKKNGHTASGVQRYKCSCGKHSFLRPERFLTSIAFPSANGWSIVRTSSGMSAFLQIHGTTRMRSRRPSIGSTRCS